MKDGVQVDGVRIAQARQALPRDTKRPISQAKFAEMVGLHWVTVSNLERGKARASLNTLTKISNITGLPLEHFLVTDGVRTAGKAERTLDEIENLAEALMALVQLARENGLTPRESAA